MKTKALLQAAAYCWGQRIERAVFQLSHKISSVELNKDLSKKLSLISVINGIQKKELVQMAVEYAIKNQNKVFGIKNETESDQMNAPA